MTRCETTKGDPGKFSVSLSFHRDPDDGQGATQEESASWGAFQIWVNGTNLCAHRQANETYDRVNWYLLPLLEWFVENWDNIEKSAEF